MDLGARFGPHFAAVAVGVEFEVQARVHSPGFLRAWQVLLLLDELAVRAVSYRAGADWSTVEDAFECNINNPAYEVLAVGDRWVDAASPLHPSQPSPSRLCSSGNSRMGTRTSSVRGFLFRRVLCCKGEGRVVTVGIRLLRIFTAGDGLRSPWSAFYSCKSTWW